MRRFLVAGWMAIMLSTTASASDSEPRFIAYGIPVGFPDNWIIKDCTAGCDIPINIAFHIDLNGVSCEVSKIDYPGIILASIGAKITWKIEQNGVVFDKDEAGYLGSGRQYGIQVSRSDWKDYFDPVPGSGDGKSIVVKRNGTKHEAARRVFAYDINVKYGKMDCSSYGPLIVNRD